jgi:hypothetical protein
MDGSTNCKRELHLGAAGRVQPCPLHRAQHRRKRSSGAEAWASLLLLLLLAWVWQLLQDQ